MYSLLLLSRETLFLQIEMSYFKVAIIIINVVNQKKFLNSDEKTFYAGLIPRRYDSTSHNKDDSPQIGCTRLTQGICPSSYSNLMPYLSSNFFLKKSQPSYI